MRLAWVDYAKGLGIILVVFGHANRGLYSAGVYLSERTYQLIDSIVYSFHMPLFFFLSGLFFVQSLEKRGKTQFILGKIDTIVYPYIIWSFLQGSIEVLLSHYTNNPTHFSGVLSLLTQPRAQFWFLYALFMIFALATLLYTKKSYNLLLPIMLILSALLYILVGSKYHSFHVDYIIQFFVFFLAGAFAIKYTENMAHCSVKTTALLFVVFLFLQWLFHIYFQLVYTNIGTLSLLLAATGIALIVAISIQLEKIGMTWLKKLGELSMIIYLMHILAASGMRIFSIKFLHIENWYINALTGTLCGIIVPVIAYSIINRIKFNFLFEPPSRFSLQRIFNKR